MEEFDVGDIVRLKNGEAHQKVVKVYEHRIDTEYKTTNHTQLFRRKSDFIKIEQKEETPMAKLYKVTGEEIYGTFLTEDSQGRAVLEIRGSQEVKAFDLDKIEEVIPYTVQVMMNNGQTADFAVKKGSLEAGDLVVMGIHLGRVQKIDTKNRNPKKTPGDLAKVGTVPLA